MKTKIPFLYTYSFLMLLMVGCSTPTAVSTAPLPTATLTSIPPTETSTAIPPTETPIPVVYLQGTVHFQGANQDPFATLIELHGDGDFENATTVQAGADGKYAFVDVKPGNYRLWVLINAVAEMIPGCTDVVFPDETWKAGFKLDRSTAMSAELTLFSKAIDTSVAFGSSGWESSATGSSTTTGIFAISPVIELVEDNTMELDVVLTCK